MDDHLIRQHQQERLAAVADHFHQTPFYRDKLNRAGLDLSDAHTLQALSQAPFTMKQELRDTPPDYRSPYSPQQLEYIFSSSGTTGSPTTYYWTREDTAVLREVGGRAMRRVGVGEGDLVLIVAPLGLPVMWYCMTQQYNAAGAGIIMPGIQPPAVLLNYLVDYPVTVLITLPVIASRLFEYARQFRPDLLSAIHLRQIHCGGDFLSEARRRRIERDWNVDCYNFLGMSEILGPLAGEGPARDGLHLAWEHILVEVIDPLSQQPAPPGRPGVAVYTTLWPKGAPLLRYWSDDYVAWAAPGGDGVAGPRLRYVGRSSDCVLSDGRAVFAQDIEECVLAYPVGDEWQLAVDAHGPAVLTLEHASGAPLDGDALRADVSALIDRPVDLRISRPGAFSREAAKPNRLVWSTQPHPEEC